MHGEQNQKWISNPCLLGGPKEGRNARSPLQSWGFKSPSAGNKGTRGPQQRRTKSEVAALSSPRPIIGRKCYVTPAISGVHNAKCGEQHPKWLAHPFLLGGPKKGGKATSPMHSRGSPTPSTVSKVRNWFLTKKTISEVAAPALPSQGPKSRRNCYVRPAFSGFPNKGDNIRNSRLTAAYLPLHSRG